MSSESSQPQGASRGPEETRRGASNVETATSDRAQPEDITGEKARRPRRRWGWRIAASLAALTLIVVALALWRLQAPLPDTAGTIRISGAQGRIEILRDVDAIPHIRAASEADALFGLGYVHAQERLWQMEFQRRIAQGRLSEILGQATVDTDRLLRTIGLARAAHEAWTRLDAPTRALVEAYVAGVNQFLATHSGGGLPIEFAILRCAPDPWRGEDVIAWQKVMAWSLSMNWREELLRARLTARVGLEAAGHLVPAYTVNGPIILPAEPPAPVPGAARRELIQPPLPRPGIGTELARDLTALGDALRALPYMPVPGGGSNNWVVAGTRAVTGKPLLANDPHLGGQTPAVWFLAHVTGGRLDVIGATLPGVPGVVIGHNRRIAWGVTNFMTDVQDLYIEHVNMRDQAEYNAAWEPMTVVRDVIKVRGERDVPLRIRITRHGPLVSDVLDDAQEALALRWTGLDPDDATAEGFVQINLATTWDEFTGALSHMHVPMQNFVYADVDGNIGYYGPGAIPVRGGSDGTIPVPGWTDAYDWRGYVHESEWPKALNPARGYLASANNQVAPDTYPFLLSTSWDAPYRVARIVELIERTGRMSGDDFARMQRDVQSAQVKVVLPFLLRARPLDTAAREAMDRLRAWDGTLAAESPDAALYEAWYQASVQRLFADELGDDLWADYARHRSVVAKAVDRLIQSEDAAWCDDVRTAEPETCETILGQSLAAALEAESARQGSSDVARWRWDRVNAATFPHLPFDKIRVLRPFFSRTLPRGGDAFTITPTMPIRDEIFVSSYRQIIDLSSLDASRFMIPMGQSGHVWSPHYADLLDRWAKGEYLQMRFSAGAVDAAVAGRLVLEPR